MLKDVVRLVAEKFREVPSFWKDAAALCCFVLVLFMIKPLFNAVALFSAVCAFFLLRERIASKKHVFFAKSEIFVFGGTVCAAWLLVFFAFCLQTLSGIPAEFDEVRHIKLFLSCFFVTWLALKLSRRAWAAGMMMCGYFCFFAAMVELVFGGFRRVGLGMNPNWLAVYGVGFVLSLFYFSEMCFSRFQRRTAMSFFGAALGLCVTVVATGSRAGLLALLCGFLVFGIFGGNTLRFRLRMAGAGVFILIVAWLLPSSGLNRAGSVVKEREYASTALVAKEMTNGRFEIWRACWEQGLRNNFWIGGGADSLDFVLGNNYRVTNANGKIHNSFLDKWVEYGLMGAASVLLLIFSNAATGFSSFLRKAPKVGLGLSPRARLAVAMNISLSTTLFLCCLFEVVPNGRHEIIIISTLQVFSFLELLHCTYQCSDKDPPNLAAQG